MYLQGLLHYYHIKSSRPLQTSSDFATPLGGSCTNQASPGMGFLQERPQCPLSNLLQSTGVAESLQLCNSAWKPAVQHTSAGALNLNYASLLTVFSSWQFHWKKEKTSPNVLDFKDSNLHRMIQSTARCADLTPITQKYNLCQQKEHSRCCWRCYCSREN